MIESRAPTKPPPKSQTNIAIYARYSSHNQDDNTSVEVQLEACKRVAGHKCREYIDRAVTGTTMVREAFDRLLTDCQAGSINVIYVYKWDRFGRSARAHAVIADLEEMGVRVVSATEGEEPLSRGIQLVVAEDYSRKLSERVVAAKKRRFEQGAWHGGVVPYGYRVVEQDKMKRLEPDWDGEAETVQSIFQAYVQDNVGYKQIARDLNTRGIAPRSSRHWTGGTIRMILANTIYVGRPARLGKSNSNSQYHDRTNHNNPNRMERKDESLQIVSDEAFDQVQRNKKLRKSLRPTGRNTTRRFSRLLTCACCGSTFIARRSGGAPEDRDRWTCSIRVRIDKHLCSNHVWLSERQLVQFIDERFGQMLKASERLISEATAEVERLVKSIRKQANGIQRQIAALDADLNRLAHVLIDPDLSDPAVKRLISRQVAEKSDQRDHLQEQVHVLLDGANDLTEKITRATRQAFEEASKSLANITSSADYNQFVRDFIGPMTVDAEGNVRPLSESSGAGAHVAEAMQYRLFIQNSPDNNNHVFLLWHQPICSRSQVSLLQ